MMPDLKISPKKAILLLNRRIEAVQTMRENPSRIGYYDFLGWCSKTYAVIDEIFGADGIHPEEIRSIGVPTCSCNTQAVVPMLLEVYHSRLLDYVDEIQGLVKTPE